MSAVDSHPRQVPDAPMGDGDPSLGSSDGGVVGGKSAARSLVELGAVVAAIVLLAVLTGQVDL